MAIPVIKDSNRRIFSHSHSPTFLSHNDYTKPMFEASDMEMITMPAVKYTSLRDIIQEHPPPPPPVIVSPANNSSWNKIPIKNPLVKQAALAYLQPVSTPTEVGNKGLFDMLKEKCFCRSRGELGCFDWLNDVFFKKLAGIFLWFCKRRVDDSEEEEVEDIVDREGERKGHFACTDTSV